MNRKILIATLLLAAIGIVFAVFYGSRNFRLKEPVIIKGFASIEEVSLDGMIIEADLIVIGSVNSNMPSRWNTADGKLPESVTAKNINSKYVIFTDQLFLPDRIMKGNESGLVRIRHFGGQVDNDIVTISGEAPLEVDQRYLLFLVQDTSGTTASINQGHYIVLGSVQGVYKVYADKAISYRDEWLFEDLIAYIENMLASENVLLTETPVPTP